jgi:hypothetical protein
MVIKNGDKWRISQQLLKSTRSLHGPSLALESIRCAGAAPVLVSVVFVAIPV